MSRKYRQITEIMALMERGDKAAEISDDNNALIKRLQDHAGPKGKAKGKMTIEIEYEVEGPMISMSVTHKVKEPAQRKSQTHLFVDPEGCIITEHPKQIPMFPHDVAERASS
jgi:hypothetical protein